MLHEADHPRGPQGVELRAGMHGGLGDGFEDPDVGGDTDADARAAGAARVVLAAFLLLSRLDTALGAELNLVLDGGGDFQVFVGLEHRCASDVGGNLVVGVGEGESARSLQRGALDSSLAGRVSGHIPPVLLGVEQLLDDGVENRAVRPEAEIALVLFFLFIRHSGLGGGLVLRLQAGQDADAGCPARVEHVHRLKAEARGTGILRVEREVDVDAGPRLVFGLGELDDLMFDELVVALQVELVDARDDVVGLPVDEPLDWRSALAVDHRLAQFEGQAEEGEVDLVVALAERLVVERDPGELAVDLAAVEVLGVHRGRHDIEAERIDLARAEQIDRHAVDGVLLGQRELDVVRLIDIGGARIVLHGDHDIVGVVDQPSDGRAAPARVVDGVFGDQGGRPDVDHVPVVIDVAGLVRVGLQRVDLELDQVAVLGVGDDRAVDLGVDVRLGEGNAEAQPRGAVGEGGALGFCLRLVLAVGADVDGLGGLDGSTGGDGDRGVDDAVSDRERTGDSAVAGLLLGLGLDARAGLGVAGDHDAAVRRVEPRAAQDVDGGGRLGLAVGNAEEFALGRSRRVGGRGGVQADGHVAQQLGVLADVDRGLGLLVEDLDRQGNQVADLIQKRLEDEVVDLLAHAQQGGQVAVLGLGEDVDGPAGQLGAGADIDQHVAQRDHDRRGVDDVGGVDAAGPEVDIAAPAGRIIRVLQRREPHAVVHVNPVGKGLEKPAVGEGVAGETDLVPERVGENLRGALFQAVDLELRRELAVEALDLDGISAVAPLDHQRFDRDAETEHRVGYPAGAVVDLHPLEPDLHHPVIGRRVVLDDDRVGETGALHLDVEEVGVDESLLEKVLVVNSGVPDVLAVEMDQAAEVGPRSRIENGVLARQRPVDPDGVQAARAPVEDAAEAAVLLESERVARPVAGANEVLKVLEPYAGHFAGVRAVDCPSHHGVVRAVQRVEHDAAHDLVDGGEAPGAGGRHVRQVDADGDVEPRIVQDVHRPCDRLISVFIGLLGVVGSAVDLAGHGPAGGEREGVRPIAALEILNAREEAAGLEGARVGARDRPGIVLVRADDRVAHGLPAALHAAGDRAVGREREVVVRAAANQVLDSFKGRPARDGAAIGAADDPVGVLLRPEDGVVAGARTLVDGVGPAADRENIGVVAAASRQGVVARPAGQAVGSRVAGQRVVARAADEVLDVGDVAGVFVDARRRGRAQVRRDGIRERGVVEGVAALVIAFDDRVGPEGIQDIGVVARPAGQRVVAGPAGQDVGSRVAGQGVVARAADEVLDVRDVAGDSRRRCAERCADVGREGRVIEGIVAAAGGLGDGGRLAGTQDVGVVTSAARECVGPRSADQHVTAAAAPEDIVATCAVEHGRAAKGRSVECIGAGPAGQMGSLDRRQGVVPLAADGQTRAGQREVRIPSLDDRVETVPSDEEVLAQAAGQDVIQGVAGDRIAPAAADDVLDHVAAGEVDGQPGRCHLGPLQGQVDNHT
ncbi:MAG: hypothetical protein BWX88_03612 [Planctomycetes bacterium ADurb.Bin126]|nr:MAG: hypothetical protein BWX88_03612 [Planctomycetes bacterium ADurb.Bin126]